ncbi:uncharacterized protein LOC143291284 [Babylonia areolata]|uniref:uncharacterized protein LOC143291284 n=1 Tax=Babylonia areolata TaxID=304850 RepID=UPI003FD0FB71
MAGITTSTVTVSLSPAPPQADGTVLTTGTSTARKYEDFTEVKVAVLIDRIYIPLVVTLGVAGNTLCFLTLVFSPLRHTSTCVYMAAIAVLDCVILVLDLCVLLRGYMGHTLFYLANDWACGFHNFLFYFAIHYDVLLLLAMTVDRFVVVRFPFRAHTLCTPRSALKAIAAVGVFSFALNFQIFFTRRLGDSGKADDPLKCWYPDPDVAFFMRKVYTWIDASIYSFIPFVSLLVLNVLIIRQLRSSRKFSRQFTEGPGSRKNADHSLKCEPRQSTANSEMETSNTELNCSEELTNSSDKTFPSNTVNANPEGGKTKIFTISQRGKKSSRLDPGSVRRKRTSSTNITVMFLLVSFTFLLLTSPVVIVLLYKRYYWLPDTPQALASARLTHAVVDNLMYTNHAVNFLLYCISGARFRHELKRLLLAMCCCFRR